MPNNNEDSSDWKSLAQFWQTKYHDQLLHFTQVITVLNRSLLMENAARRQQQVAPQNGNSVVLEPTEHP